MTDVNTSAPASQEDTNPPVETTTETTAETTADTENVLAPDKTAETETQTAETATGDDAPLELSLPEGVDIDGDLLDGYKTTAKEAGLNSEQASSLVKWYAETQAGLEKAQADALEAQNGQWLDELKADPELGGQNFEATCTAAKKALVAFGGPDLAKLYVNLGMQNHPASVRAWAAVGKAMAEDNSGGKRTPSGSEKGPNAFLDDLYDHPGSSK